MLKNKRKLFLCMTSLLILLIFIAGIYEQVSAAKIIDFPDTLFKDILLSKGVDTDGDGEISVSEAETAVLNLSFSGVSGYYIVDISGLEYFTGLQSLMLPNNKIRDISPLLNLPLVQGTPPLLLIDNNPLYDGSPGNPYNGVELGTISDYYGNEYEVWTTAGTISSSINLDESNLAGAFLEIELNPVVGGITFVDNSLDKNNFIFNTSSLAVERVEYLDNKKARIYLSHNGSDIDNLELTIKGVELSDSSLEPTFDKFPVRLVDDNEIMAVSDDGSITAGQEDGEILTVKIYGGNFVENINSANWEIRNLPDGVSMGNVTRVDSSTVEIGLDGNSDGGSDLYSINLTVSCTVDEYQDSTGDTVLEAVLTDDNTEPEVSSLSPANGDDNVKYDDLLIINFDEEVIIDGGNINIYRTADNELIESIDVNGSQLSGNFTKSITIGPETTLDGGTGYYILIDGTCFKDVQGNYNPGIRDKTGWYFTTVIDFPDKNLKQAVLEETYDGKTIDQNGDQEISISEAESIISWDFSGDNISDLEGLEYFTSLQELYLDDNKISDLTPLENLITLTKLDLNSNKISDIGLLAGLESLTDLNLYYNTVSDLTPLSDMNLLENLNLRYNDLSNIEPLSGLANLEVLNLNSNKISDISPLVELYSLKDLDLNSNNYISDLEPLSNLINLLKLKIGINQISDLSPLSELSSLEYLSLPDNQISDLSPLAGLGSLNYLCLTWNNISDLTPLKNLANLSDLELGDNQISDLEPLKDLNSLEILDLCLNNIEDITPLANLTNLKILYLHINNISDLSPLAGLSSLTDLSLYDNNISNIGPLSSLNSLESLGMYNNNVSDLRPLSPLTALINGYYLYLYDNPLYDSSSNNAIKLGQLGRYDNYEVWVPAGFVRVSSRMTEIELDDAYIELEIYPTVFTDSSLDKASFMLENVPTGVSIEGVDYIDENECRVNLAFDGTDFTTDFTDLKLTIKGVEVASDDYGYSYSAANGTALVFKDDMPDIGADETVPDGHSVSFDDQLINDSEKGSRSFTFTDAEPGTTYSYTITDEAGNQVSGTGGISTAGQTVAGIDLGGLSDGTLTLSVVLEDRLGKIADPVTDTTILDKTHPVLESLSPSTGETDVSIAAELEMVFTEEVEIGSGFIRIYKVADDSLLEEIDVNSGQVVSSEQVSGAGIDTITVDPAENFMGSTEYYLQIDSTAFIDLAGNNYPGINDKSSWSFTTVTRPEVDVLMSDSYESGVTLSVGEIITYQIETINNSEAKLSSAKLYGSIPSNTNYVSGSTKLNGQPVVDNGKCPLFKGLMVNSPGEPEGVIAQKSNTKLSYQVRVDEDLVTGSRISNQLELDGQDKNGDKVETVISDDPDTGRTPDATVSLVGEGAVLDASREVIDTNGGEVEGGDELQCNTVITNLGARNASNVILKDRIPENTSLIEGSIMVGNTEVPYTSTEDGDMRLSIGLLSAGADVAVSFGLKVDESTEENVLIISQGTVSSADSTEEKTDADGDDSNGDQPNEVMVGKYPLLISQLQAKDINGGQITAGDIIEYTIKIGNTGNASAAELTITNQLPGSLEYVAGSTELNGTSLADIAGNSPLAGGLNYGDDYGLIESGETVSIKYRAKIPESTVGNTNISNQLEYTAVARAVDTGGFMDKNLSGRIENSIQPGGIPGQININGEAGSLIGNLPAGWKVELWNGGNKIGEKIVDQDGLFQFKGLSVDNNYRLLLRHPETDVIYYQIEIAGLAEGSSKDEGLLPMDPSGIIYDAVTRELIAGAVVTLIGPDSNPVPEDYLLEGQQYQQTGSDGFYCFDLDFTRAPAGEYLIEVASPAGYLDEFPSKLIAVAREEAVDPVSDAALDAVPATTEFEVVDSIGAPASNEDTTYYLNFDLEADDPDILNNHIPLDPAAVDLMSITKTAGKEKAVVGGFVSYQLEISNESGRGIDTFAVYDKLPAGFKYVEGSTMITKENEDTVELEPDGKRLLTWNGLSLATGERLTISYTLVVGTGVVQNEEYVNKAYLQQGNTVISSKAESAILITADPVFDGSTIIGKVFNDLNGNDIQDRGESGVKGVDILSISGQTITTDEYGRYHLIVKPADSSTQLGQTIVLKLDSSTLPEGAEILSDNPVIIKLPAGLMQKVNFSIGSEK